MTMSSDYAKYLRASNGDGPAATAFLSDDRGIGDMSVITDNVLNWPSYFVATVGDLNTDGTVDVTSIFLGHLEGSIVMIDEFAPGYLDEGFSEGQVIFIKPASVWADIVAGVISEGGGGASVTISDTPPAGAEAGDLWGDTSDDGLASLIVAVGNANYPVGSTYFNKTNSTNPATLLGFGTWARLEGVVLGGRSETGGSPFNVAGGTVIGADTHTLTEAQMPEHSHAKGTLATSTAGAHTHTIAYGDPAQPVSSNKDSVQVNWVNRWRWVNSLSDNGSHTHTITGETANTGGGQSHPNIQRTLVGYLWERIS